MRQVVLDTETTGLDPQQGHRVIEIGCVELQNRRRTDKKFQCYLNPDRDIDEAAIEVHGLTSGFLADKPRFNQVEKEFLEFIGDTELIIHNAPFDIGFLNHELDQTGSVCNSLEGICTVLDTLLLAREKHPGQRNSLDALCKRFNIDNSKREKHNALIDCHLLKEIYVNLADQKEPKLKLESSEIINSKLIDNISKKDNIIRKIIKPNNDELKLHQKYLKSSLSKNYYK